jgi:hypothetical protein
MTGFFLRVERCCFDPFMQLEGICRECHRGTVVGHAFRELCQVYTCGTLDTLRFQRGGFGWRW